MKNIPAEHGHADPARVQAFLDAGWTQGNHVDAIVVIGAKTVTEDLHATTPVPVDSRPRRP